MCKLYIETADLDKAVEAADKILQDAGLAIIDLKSEALKQFIEKRHEGVHYVSPLQHTKFSIIVGIVIGLELARTGLSLDTSVFPEELALAAA